MHGGGFYHAQKYALAPKLLPDTLHWFKWEAYSTWLSGMFLLALLYWYGADVYLIDPGVAALSPASAVAIAAGLLVGGWLVYDLLCKSPLGKDERLLAIILLLLVGVLAWGLCQLFSGRGAYMHFGAILGTIMVANVFFVIIPGQKQMVAAAARGEAPDPRHGIRGKQRSVHNTYFTLAGAVRDDQQPLRDDLQPRLQLGDTDRDFAGRRADSRLLRRAPQGQGVATAAASLRSPCWPPSRH